jgi:hypothetical protein
MKYAEIFTKPNVPVYNPLARMYAHIWKQHYHGNWLQPVFAKYFYSASIWFRKKKLIIQYKDMLQINL